MRLAVAPALVAAALLGTAGLAVAGAPSGAAPIAEWTIDRAASRVSFTLAGPGGPVQGAFKRWTAEVAFDPAHPALGRVTISVDAASLVTGDPARDQALTGAGALGAVHAPRLVFSSHAIKPRPDGGFDAAGELKLRGASRPASAVLRFNPDPRARRIDLDLPLPAEAFAPPGRPRPASVTLAVRLAARDR